MTKLPRCKNCNAAIRKCNYHSETAEKALGYKGWYHAYSGVHYCSIDKKTVAEPKDDDEK